jgi:hypothetical protein
MVFLGGVYVMYCYWRQTDCCNEYIVQLYYIDMLLGIVLHFNKSEICLSACYLRPCLSTERNNLGAVGKSRNSNFRMSKLCPYEFPKAVTNLGLKCVAVRHNEKTSMPVMPSD